MKILVVGAGYVGLVTGACLSDVGMQVLVVDNNQQKIKDLQAGIMPIYEPGLEELVKRNVQQGRLSFSHSLHNQLSKVSVVFIAVGTPQDADGSADLKYVLQVADEIGQNLEDYLVVVTKSTVPVGAAQKVKAGISRQLQNRGLNIPFDVASNPEFLKEGDAIADFMSPDRIVIGTETEKAKNILEELYKPFLLNGFRIISMDIPSAELTKYAANAMLATRISFMNDMANLCELIGADIHQVRRGIGADPRIGNKFLYAGIGYGGACFPKDVQALMKTGLDNGHPLRILNAVEQINADQKMRLYHKLEEALEGMIAGKTIAVWGLSFKPQTDDMREAPSVVLIKALIAAGARVQAYDPVAMPVAAQVLPEAVVFSTDEYQALQEADALLLLTEWRMFRSPDWDRLKSLMRQPIVLDGRNIYNAEQLADKGIRYWGIGTTKQLTTTI